MRVQVLVRLKPGVLDVQGKAVEHGILSIGFKEVSDVRVGRLIELDLEAASFAAAKQGVAELCEKLLVNTIIETYEIREQA